MSHRYPVVYRIPLITLCSLITITTLIVVRSMIDASPRYTSHVQQFETSKSPILYGALIVVLAKGELILVSLSHVTLT